MSGAGGVILAQALGAEEAEVIQDRLLHGGLGPEIPTPPVIQAPEVTTAAFITALEAGLAHMEARVLITLVDTVIPVSTVAGSTPAMRPQSTPKRIA